MFQLNDVQDLSPLYNCVLYIRIKRNNYWLLKIIVSSRSFDTSEMILVIFIQKYDLNKSINENNTTEVELPWIADQASGRG